MGNAVSFRELHDPVIRLVEEYPGSMGTHTAWLAPLMGVASANNPLFLKRDQMPGAALYPPEECLPGARSVLVFFIPFQHRVALSNIPGPMSSREWALAYVETNRLIVAVGEWLGSFLEKKGYTSVVLPPTHDFDPETLTSRWSHRHAAVIAGLGRLGIHNMLITERGCCGRLGSLITRAPVDPTPARTREACLFRYDGSCVRCLDRCPVGALTWDGFDRFRCYTKCLENDRYHSDLGTTDVCGKCLTAVPCSFTDPVAARSRRQANPA
jgi:epoxyqueuosine reductase QueG